MRGHTEASFPLTLFALCLLEATPPRSRTVIDCTSAAKYTKGGENSVVSLYACLRHTVSAHVCTCIPNNAVTEFKILDSCIALQLPYICAVFKVAAHERHDISS